MKDIISIEILNKLIEINNDRIEGYETATKETEEPDLKKLFSKFIETSKACKAELSKEVIELGGKPVEGTSTSGKFYRVWMDIKAAFTSGIYKEILASCEYGEDVAIESYYHALMNQRGDLTPEQEAMLNKHYLAIKQDHDKIKKLKQSLD